MTELLLLLAPLQRRERVRETSSVTQTANTVTVAFPCKWRPVWPRWVQLCTYWTLLCPHLDGLIHHFFLLQSSQFIHWWTLCFWPRIVDDQWCSAEAKCAHCQCVLTLKWCKIYSEKAATVDGRQWDCWPLPDEYVLCMAMSTTRDHYDWCPCRHHCGRQQSEQGQHTLWRSLQISASRQAYCLSAYLNTAVLLYSLLVKFGGALVNCLEITAEERGSADSIRLVPPTVSGCCCCCCFCVLFTLMPVTAVNSCVAKCFSLVHHSSPPYSFPSLGLVVPQQGDDSGTRQTIFKRCSQHDNVQWHLAAANFPIIAN